MIRFLLGRRGSQVTDALLGRVCGGAAAGRHQLLVVPEQFSHDTERRLCAAGGNAVCRRAEVLSFSRLADRVFSLTGGMAAPSLDGGGRLLVMRRALDAVRTGLRVYARPSGRADFVQSLVEAADECKRCGVPPEVLTQAATESHNGRLGELGLIFAAYDGLTQTIAADPRDRLDRLAERLEEYPFALGADLYFDGFTDFTPQEVRVLIHLAEQADSLTVGLVCDHLEETEEGGGVFSPARHTAKLLTEKADKQRIRVEVEPLDPPDHSRPPSLEYADRFLFDGAPVPFEGETAGAAELFEAASPHSEAEYAAARILHLVREEGYRFRDIAVSARGFRAYAPIVEQVFAAYGVPVHLSLRTDILQKPLPSLLFSALSAVSGGYGREDMLRYLKTGLTGVARSDCDLLENYVLLWNLRGGAWTRPRPWDMHPLGYRQEWTEADRALTARLDGLRLRIIGPLERLRKSGAATAREHALALYGFLEELSLPERLRERAAALEARGALQQAREYEQLWDIFCRALEQCVDILDDTPMDRDGFADLLSLLLSQYDVSAIPVALDRVNACELDRAAYRQVRCLILLGATDLSIPQVAAPSGLLSDEDRALLTKRGFPMAPLAPERLCRELAIARNACAAAEERLLITWPVAGADGAPCRPSLLAARLLALLPDAPFLRERDMAGEFRLCAPGPALAWAAAHPGAEGAFILALLENTPAHAPAARAVRRAAALRRGALSPPSVERLYGSKVHLSATRLDQMKSCHFAYFLRYGLRAQPRRDASFRAPEMGLLVHYVLEHVLREAAAAPGGLRNTAPAALDAAGARYADQFAIDELGGLEDKTPRFRYLFQRLKKTVPLIVRNAAEELLASDFEPLAFELRFGDTGAMPPVTLTENGVTVSVGGIVDRVDGWRGGGRLYLRVVDYKTGRASFDLTEIWHGLGLQMLLYLFLLEEKGAACFQREIVPAGILYLPARDIVLQGERGMSDEALRAAADKALRRSGLLLNEPEVLAAMERFGAEGPRFLPVKLTAAGPSGDALVSEALLRKLRRHTERMLRGICRELGQGDIRADPWYRDERRSACAHCPFADACHFDESGGEDRRRYLFPVRRSDFEAAD